MATKPVRPKAIPDLIGPKFRQLTSTEHDRSSPDYELQPACIGAFFGTAQVLHFCFLGR